MGKEGQTVPAMSEEWIQTISKRYIELYEQIIGEAFKPESKTEVETFQLIRNALNNLGIQ
jgi:phosphoribosylaminoimidazole-succinocarboxamide synthase